MTREEKIIKDLFVETFFEELLVQPNANPLEVTAFAITIAKRFFKKPKLPRKGKSS